MMLKSIRESLSRSFENHGAIGTLRLVPRAAKAKVLRTFRRYTKKSRENIAAEARFDRETGVDTTQAVELAALQFDESINKESIKHGVRYQATPPHIFDAMLARTGVNASDYTLIDVGSGKGRVLFMAAMHPFRKVIGVEFSSELTRIARENIRTFKAPKQACHNIEAVCADATEFSFPPQPTVIYMYNPFAGEIMRGVVANLEGSLRTNPRDVIVVYYNARCPEHLDASPLLREVASERTEKGDEDPWVIYRSTTGR